ncbi:MAG TPA: SPFH domain-containing protein, partial [Ktedonobacterales bacterium]|nr:SPFH domain-containing protein [Ktedonobacterales bacterium]
MPDDSAQNPFDLDGEERDEGDEALPTTPQELLQELQRERERQQTPPHAIGPTQYDPPEPLSGDDGLEGGVPSRFPTASLPSWPTPPPRVARGFSSAAAAGARPRPPISNPGQPGDDDTTMPLPPTPAATPPRKAAQPSPVAPLPPRSQMRSAPSAGGAFPAWSSFRRRSFWLVPLIFILLFFFLVLLVNPPLSLALLFIFAAIGMLEAAVLFNVSNDAFWVVGVVAGFILMTAVAFFAFFSPIFATVLSILLLALGVVAIRERYYAVKEGTVAVMGLFEKYNRTLQPGFNLRVPGEKVLGIVSTHRERYQARIPSLTLSTGEHVALDVAMSYQIIPGQEYLAIRNTKDWKEPLQQLLVEVTQDVVSTLTFADFLRQPGGQPAHIGAGGSLSDSLDDEHEHAPLARINERLTHEMRDQ